MIQNTQLLVISKTIKKRRKLLPLKLPFKFGCRPIMKIFSKRSHNAVQHSHELHANNEFHSLRFLKTCMSLKLLQHFYALRLCRCEIATQKLCFQINDLSYFLHYQAHRILKHTFNEWPILKLFS